MSSFERMILRPGQHPEEEERQRTKLRLGDNHEAMLVQSALMLLFYGLRHQVEGISVVPDDRSANSAALRHAAEREWVGGNDTSVTDVTHPAAAFRAYLEEHPDRVVDIHDRGELERLLRDMGVDAIPLTLR